MLPKNRRRAGLTGATSSDFTQTSVRGQECLHPVRELKLGQVPIAGLPLRVDLVQVVVERGLGVEDLLAGPALEPRLLGCYSVVSCDFNM